jgi:hypothetical protein
MGHSTIATSTAAHQIAQMPIRSLRPMPICQRGLKLVSINMHGLARVVQKRVTLLVWLAHLHKTKQF